jgi:hypothetical protein
MALQITVAEFLKVAEQTPKSSFSNSDASKKEIMHKRCRRPIIDYRFHPGEGPRSQNNAFSKAIIWHNQLRPDLKISPCKIELLNFTYAIISTFRCQYFKSLSGSLTSRQSQNSARTKCTTESSGA